MNMDKNFFKDVIDDALEQNDMSTFYILFVSLISADNNRTESEIKKNCELIDILINVLESYPNNEILQEHRQQLIKYNKMYKE